MGVLLGKLVQGRGGGLYGGQSRQRNAETMAYLAEQNRKFQLFMGVVVEHLEQKVAVQQQAFETMADQAPLDLRGWGGRSGSSFAISPEEIQAIAEEDELGTPAAASEVVDDSVEAPQEQTGTAEEATSGWRGDEMRPHDPFGAENSTVASVPAGSLAGGMPGPIDTVLNGPGTPSDRVYEDNDHPAEPQLAADHTAAGSALLASWEDEAEDAAEIAAPLAVKSLAAFSWGDVPETTNPAGAIETQNPEPELKVEAGQQVSQTEESWKTLLLGEI